MERRELLNTGMYTEKQAALKHGTLCRVYGADAGLRYMVYYNGCEGDTIR